jgi:hypothetical protein
MLQDTVGKDVSLQMSGTWGKGREPADEWDVGERT